MPLDVSRASVVTIPTVVTTIIAVVLTLLRLYVRRYVIRMMSWDDFFNVLATVGVVSMPVVLLFCTNREPAVCNSHPRVDSRSIKIRLRTTHAIRGPCSRGLQYQALANLRVHHDLLHHLPQDFHQPVPEEAIVSLISKHWHLAGKPVRKLTERKFNEPRVDGLFLVFHCLQFHHQCSRRRRHLPAVYAR